ncbi:WW domain-binding protein 4-like isoform X2 [Brevipalpus obovatus]|uniref:WW domain-binding protein 4-like isoform X2 n=1 Tax=Brevipalpus obovatus TaxID=246614 RepID=UPI003D9F06D9
MSEYWKSLPKKYCDICKCWFADNKSSVEFHERGLRHKNNVQKKLAQLQKDGVKEQKSIDKYNSDIMKIEAAAMSAFAKDVINDPKRAKEYGASVSLTDKLKVSEKKSQPTVTVNRFGFDDSEKTEQYQNLGREKALEAITSKMEKKAQWLESKTGEGVSFYWNRKTLDTKWEPPKEGFMSIEEQQRLGMSTTTGPINSAGQPETLKYNPLGQWRTVEEKHDSEEDIDFQLPKKRRELSKGEQKAAQIASNLSTEEKFEFKEKTLEVSSKHAKSCANSVATFSFKRKRSRNPEETAAKKEETES